MNINGKTNLLGLIGQPVEHSFSPYIHNYLFRKYKKNCVYACFDVDKECLDESIKGIKALKILGCNITIPHKVNIIKYLDDIDKNAMIIGAVNTIKNENGKLIGYNTDGIGFVKSITDTGYCIKEKKIMILGCGGGARSIAVELASKGVSYIELRNRTLDKAIEISNIIIDNFNIITKVNNMHISKNDIENIDILINTTPLGMENYINVSPIDETIKIDKSILVCDIVYNPRETKLIKWAKNNNLDVIYGIDMLVNQAIHSFNIWTGENSNDNEEVKNIILEKI